MATRRWQDIKRSNEDPERAARVEARVQDAIMTQSCPECGGTMRYETRPNAVDYKGHTRTVETLGWWCTGCGEGILTGEPLAANERAFLELKSEVDHTELRGAIREGLDSGTAQTVDLATFLERKRDADRDS